MTSFSLRIFVADGDPDGLRIVEKSNWIGKPKNRSYPGTESVGGGVGRPIWPTIRWQM